MKKVLHILGEVEDDAAEWLSAASVRRPSSAQNVMTSASRKKVSNFSSGALTLAPVGEPSAA